jgi:hypothetical protein
MSKRGSRGGWMITISALLLTVWLAGVSVVTWRGLGPNTTRITNRLARIFTGRGHQPDDSEAIPIGPTRPDDPRLSSLRLAAGSWQRSAGPRRLVVDQVCLVPDVPAFFEAIALWDERQYFPILIDEPAWTLPFLRAFRPARVVRYAGRAKPAAAEVSTDASALSAGSNVVWSQALEAVARAWSDPSESERELPAADRRPRALGSTPPGLVLTAPQAPMLAGAVALAAGHFQPLIRLQAPGDGAYRPGDSGRPQRFGDVMSLQQAWRFAQSVEARVTSVIPHYDQLGDDCDFLTLAGDWPYRYSYDLQDEPIRGVYALDDLIGRVFDAATQGGWLQQARRRWAYTGRLLGDPAASVARAMGALFLQPSSALLWNTYSGGKPWSDYTMGPAAADLSRAFAGVGSVVHRSGQEAGVANWHRAVDPVNRFGIVLFNSSGGPDMFTISGGVGRPSDFPRGMPTAVAMIHSFSAADPNDPQTIASRWLSQGAFAYFGAVNEPFLLSFRPPGLVAALLAAEVPFVAALRQGELEAFGFPWRLVYLGDPLYRLQNTASTPDRPRSKDAAHAGNSDRVLPSEWRKKALDYENWPVVEITVGVPGSKQHALAHVFDSEDDRFRWCLDASIQDLAGVPSDGWREALREIRRDRLGRGLRPRFDELLIDTLAEVGAIQELMARLAQVPPDERGPRVWQAIETCAIQRLARMSDDREITRAFIPVLDLWDQVMRLSWPKSSHFPSHFSERVGALALDDSRRSRLWHDRLRKTSEAMAAQPSLAPHAAVIAAEQARVRVQLGGLGSSR